MKPRIVREPCVPAESMGLNEYFHGRAYLALPWPPDCPYTPEQVMAACERRDEVMASVPCPGMCVGEWRVFVGSYRAGRWALLTPEFIGESKCDAPGHEWTPPENCYSVCPKCNAILSDRRLETRRKGERREEERRSFKCGGRRNHGSDPRRCKDRRRP